MVSMTSYDALPARSGLRHIDPEVFHWVQNPLEDVSEWIDIYMGLRSIDRYLKKKKGKTVHCYGFSKI